MNETENVSRRQFLSGGVSVLLGGLLGGLAGHVTADIRLKEEANSAASAPEEEWDRLPIDVLTSAILDPDPKSDRFGGSLVNKTGRLTQYIHVYPGLEVKFSRPTAEGERVCWMGYDGGLSKAALLASAFLLVVSTIFGSESKADRNKIIRSVILLVVVFALIYLVMYGEYDFLTQNKTISVMRKKLANMSNENDTSLDSGRGYSRMGEIGINVLWGVGEGAFTRFNALSGVEVHSTYVNMIVSYGLIGFLGYAYIWLKPLLYGKRGLANLMLFSGILLYGVTHNGIRNTVLWTIIALIFLEKIDAEKRMEAPPGNALYGYSSAEY